MSSSARVLIVDPCDAYRRAIADAIEQEQNGLTVVAEATKRWEAPAAASASAPDVILLCLSEVSEYRIIPVIHEKVPSARVVVFSLRDDGEAVVEAIRAGAAGFVPKRASGREILGALGRSAEGSVAVHTSVLEPALLWASSRLDGAEERHPLNLLTPRERTVLEMLAEGLNASTIAQRLFLSRRTIDDHLASVYRKLGVRGRIEAVYVFAGRREVS